MAWPHLSIYNENEKKNYSYDIIKSDAAIKIYQAKEKKGYEVRVLDLINMEKSHCYNPFVYLKMIILRLIRNICIFLMKLLLECLNNIIFML